MKNMNEPAILEEIDFLDLDDIVSRIEIEEDLFDETFTEEGNEEWN